MRQVEMIAVARRVVEDYLGVGAGERFLIVTDTRTGPLLAPALAGQALALGADPVIAVMSPRSRSGEEPPATIAAAMIEADVVLAAASRSCYHTEAKGAAQAHDTRGLFNAPSEESARIRRFCAASAFLWRRRPLRRRRQRARNPAVDHQADRHLRHDR